MLTLEAPGLMKAVQWLRQVKWMIFMAGVTDPSGHRPRYIWVYLFLFFLYWYWDPLKTSCFGGIPISSTGVLTFTVICFLKMALNRDPGLSMKLALASQVKDPRFNILAPKRQNVTSLLSACVRFGVRFGAPASYFGCEQAHVCLFDYCRRWNTVYYVQIFLAY